MSSLANGILQNGAVFNSILTRVGKSALGHGVGSAMVEHRIVVPTVAGSSPVLHPKKTVVYLMRHEAQGSRIDN